MVWRDPFREDFVSLECPETVITYSDRSVPSPLGYRLGLAFDTGVIGSIRFAISRWLDRLADLIRPTASMSDIRIGMSHETERKVRTAILAAYGSTRTLPPVLPRTYIPITDELAEDLRWRHERGQWARMLGGHY